VSAPFFLTVATALATQSVGALFELVKIKFAARREAAAALEAATGAAADSPEVAAVAGHLAAAAEEDPGFAAELQRTWSATAEHDGVVNQITGKVTGKVVQARDIEGGVTF
jgi:hypothetical protein